MCAKIHIHGADPAILAEGSWEEREACRELCMEACLRQQMPACKQHATAFCAEAFASSAAVSGQQQQGVDSGSSKGKA